MTDRIIEEINKLQKQIDALSKPERYRKDILRLENTAQNTGPASLVVGGLNGLDHAFVYREVFDVNVTSITEISRITGSGQNGFAGFVKITVVGHTTSVGNGGLVNEYTFSVVTVTLARSLDMFAGNAPTLTLSFAGSVLTISLTSANGTSTFHGIMEITYYVPRDFVDNTWVVS